MWYENLGFETIIAALIIWIVIFFVLKLMFSNKKIFGVFLAYIFSLILAFVLWVLKIPYTEHILLIVGVAGLLIAVIVVAPDIRDSLENMWGLTKEKSSLIMGSEKTKNNILDAVVELSKTKTGALITIEKHNTLDQYAEKAITLDSEVSKEILLNIFVPNTPLHDGAVIVRGDRILCAGAYYVLSNNENFNKSTAGSRHRAGLGISEVSDSLTIIVSEETGTISIAIEGILLKMNDRDKLNEYLTTFMK